MSDTCRLFPPFGDPWPSYLLPSHFHVLAIVNSDAMDIGEHVIFLYYGFIQVYAQEWDCWVIWKFYFQFFKESP